MWERKKITIPLIILLLVAIGVGSHIIGDINLNVEKMSELGEDAPHYPAYPPIDTKGKDTAAIKRGEYLAKAGDCIACHTNTPEKGKPFAGGLPMNTPFGTIYSPNITPDKKTGIGNWTDAQFVKAMRQGISPQGHYYYPAFPYYYFSKVTLQDLKDIKTYLNSIPAVQQANHKNEMVEPFNARFLQLGWRMLFFRPQNTGLFKPNPKQSAQWNRGAYLVEGLGHCAMCHSPSYYIVSNKLSLGAPIQKYNLTGAKIQGYLAPNITEENLAKISDQEITEVFTQDRLIGGGRVAGPMLEVNHNSLKHLTQSDLLAIAKYLRSVQSISPPKPKPGKGGPGGAIYEGYCSGCHTTGAGGAPKYGDPASWHALLNIGIHKVYTNAIKGIGGMPAKGTCLSCSDEEIKQAVDYMIAAVAGKRYTPIPGQRKLTLTDGKNIYDTNCAVCHNVGFKNAPKPGDKEAWKPIIKAGFLAAYQNIVAGKKGHPPQGACPNCSDAELIAAIKYMMQQSTTAKDYILW